jgi:tetratricopeptide (TPR) repeat protein
MRGWGLVGGLLLFSLGLGSSQIVQKSDQAPPGSEACASCHAEIYNSYSKTVMARASGAASDGVITGEFRHKVSGVTYRVYQQNGRTWMSYDRGGELRGQRELLYFIGSGVKGRSYLFSGDGFLFETPINWYSQEHRWNMTPAYTEAKQIPMNLPAYVDCLNCHTSGMQAPVAGTDSKFSGKPFLYAGITCERCHGAGEGHLDGKGAMVNPAKLPAERRDAICVECHFEGTVAIEQPGKHLYEFQPGDRLAEYTHYFLLKGTAAGKAQAVSQVEALSQSGCKRKSGDKMSCMSCHDPHREPNAEEKAAYYRGRCLACHGEKFAAQHHPDKPDCVACHMPPLPSKDVAHTEATDHRILRYPNGLQFEDVPAVGSTQKLEAFPPGEAMDVSTRDLALAWETLAQRHITGSSRQAEEYLRKAVKERPDDAVLLSALGFVEQQNGHDKEARELYERALRVDPLANDAATNLGALEARAGNLRRAVQLWQGAFANVPHRSQIGLNLALAFCESGQRDQAQKYVNRVLEFNPDAASARSLLMHMSENPAKCKP